MAIAISEPVAEIFSTANSSQTTAAFTPADNSLLVVFAWKSGTSVTPVASGGGLTWTLRGTQSWTDESPAAGRASIYTAPVVTGASMQITVSSAGNEGSGAFIAVFQVTGHKVSDPVKQVDTGGSSGASSTPTATMPASMSTDDGYMSAYVRNGGSDPGSTPPASWTETADGSTTVPDFQGSAAYRAGGESGTTITFTLPASKTWYIQAIEINIAGTVFEQSIAGSVTFSGAIAKQVNKNLAGTLTLAGAVARAVSKIFRALIFGIPDPTANARGMPDPSANLRSGQTRS